MSASSSPQQEAAVSQSTGGRAGRGWGVLRGLGAAAVLLVAVEQHYSAALMGSLLQLSLVMAPFSIGVRLLAWRGRRLALDQLRRPFHREGLPYLLQALLRGSFWLGLAVVLYQAVPAALFSPEEYLVARVLLVVPAVLLALLEWLPPVRLYRTANGLFLAGWTYLAVQGIQMTMPAGAGVALDPPFRGEWSVFHGGNSGLINHHFVHPHQQYALDLDRAMKGPPDDPSRLENYPAFGAPLYAPVEGMVTAARDGLPDQAIGTTNEKEILGNYVVLRVAPDRYLLLAHLKQGSVRVRAGQTVKRGERLGACGNSGNTSEPHLHLQVQNTPDYREGETVTYPVEFRGVEVRREGRRVGGASVVPRRNDRLIAPSGEAAP